MSDGDSSSSVSAVRELLARVEAMTIDQRCPSVRRAPAGLSVPQPSPATLESSRNSSRSFVKSPRHRTASNRSGDGQPPNKHSKKLSTYGVQDGVSAKPSPAPGLLSSKQTQLAGFGDS